MPSSSSLSGLMKWLRRPEWGEAFAEVHWLHTGAACELLGVDQDEIDDVLGDGCAAFLWGCAFEDLLTRALEPDGRNMLDVYLKRRGWKETAANRRYMQALRSSVMSLYEVSGIMPGESFLARDLLRGGEPVRVSERSATRTLAPWERIGARVVALDGTHVIAGGLLPFTQEASEGIIGTLGPGRTRKRRTRTARPEQAPASAMAPASVGDGASIDLAQAAPLFTNLWLADVLPRSLKPSQPTVHNTDGDPVVFHTLRYPFLADATAERVRERLDAADELRDAGDAVWSWVESGLPAISARRPSDGDADVTLGITLDDGGLVFGTVALEGAAVVLSTNSAQRAERGRALLASLLDGLAGEPMAEVQSVDEVIANRSQDDPAPSDDIPPEVLAELVHHSLDRHYRATLDLPVGMLGGRTPRDCARTKLGRERVAEWLKSLERDSGRQRRDEADPMRSYDFSWMWDELGVAYLRR